MLNVILVRWSGWRRWSMEGEMISQNSRSICQKCDFQRWWFAFILMWCHAMCLPIERVTQLDVRPMKWVGEVSHLVCGMRAMSGNMRVRKGTLWSLNGFRAKRKFYKWWWVYIERGYRDHIPPRPQKEGGSDTRTTKNLETKTSVLGIDTKNDGCGNHNVMYLMTAPLIFCMNSTTWVCKNKQKQQFFFFLTCFGSRMLIT